MKTITVNNREFKIIKLLGIGKSGYSYLVENNKEKFVVKQIHHEPCNYYQFGNKIESELNAYNKLHDLGIRVPKMLDIDIKNERVLKEFIDGKTIYELALEDKVKSTYVNQLKEICHILYPLNINIDYFPTNFIVQDELLWYIDYECNNYMEEWNFENWGVKYWSKTPELIEYSKSL